MGTDGFSKHATSPEALAHKVAYDTEYESTPERVKYREELNQERRKRHIMGQGGPDMSHTKTGHIVPEDMHTNRARHFKERGTLKSMDMAFSSLVKDGAFQPSQYPQGERFQLTPSSDIPVNNPEDRMSRHVGMGVIPANEGAMSQLSNRPVPRSDVEQMPHPEPYSAMIEENKRQMPDTSYHRHLRPQRGEYPHWFPKDTSWGEQDKTLTDLEAGDEHVKELEYGNKLEMKSEPMDMAWDVLKKGAMSHVHQIIQDAPTPAHAIQEITSAYGISHGEAVNLISSAMSPQ